MNYELAKQLKDAGFQMNKLKGMGDRCNGDFFSYDKELYTIPTLSELIEACGKDFGSLWHPLQHIKDDKWLAKRSDIAPWNVKRDFYGDTPEEAVANLWLELNKK